MVFVYLITFPLALQLLSKFNLIDMLVLKLSYFIQHICHSYFIFSTLSDCGHIIYKLTIQSLSFSKLGKTLDNNRKFSTLFEGFM